MIWTPEDTDALRAFGERIDCDDVLMKDKIKKKLLNNRFILKVLGNQELEDDDAEATDYFDESIFPYYLIPDIQTETGCYLCYELRYSEVAKYNTTQKVQQVVFTIICHKKMIIEPNTGIPRHDLLAALVMNDFNWTPDFGHVVSDVAKMTDRHFIIREIVFEQWTDNNIVKTKNIGGISKPTIINKVDIHGTSLSPNRV